MNEDQMQVLACYDPLFKKEKDFTLAAQDLCGALNMTQEEAKVEIQKIFFNFQLRNTLSIFRQKSIWGAEAQEKALQVQVSLATADPDGLADTFLYQRLYDERNPLTARDTDRAVKFLTSAPQETLFHPIAKNYSHEKVQVNIINASSQIPVDQPQLPIHGQFPSQAVQNKIARKELPASNDGIGDFDRAIPL